jgi:hypothetical protein
MGQDVSVVLVPRRVQGDVLADVARRTFADDPPENLVLLYGYGGPGCLERVIPEFTAVELWADREDNPARFAAELSKSLGRAVVWLMADHAPCGASQVLERG